MSLHPILAEKLSAAVVQQNLPPHTIRDAKLPTISGKIHAVIGMRRAGKTTFLQQLAATKRAASPPEYAIYLSFDDDRLATIDAQQLALLLEEYYRRYPLLRGHERVQWYLDEIQLVSGWERFARRVLDTELIDLVVSGSSARMLSREVHSSLRGRGIATVIRPFSFREFLRHRNEEPAKPPVEWRAPERSRIEKRMLEYIWEGGFPETQQLTSALRIELLQGYVDTVLFRDIVERYAITQVTALRWIIRHCLRNPASSFSAHKLYQDLKAQGHGIAKDAVHIILSHLQDAFLLSAVPLATESERKRNSNPRKLYPADVGLIRAFDVSGRTQIGHALETIVFNELERRGGELAYVKTADATEVDFLVRKPGAQEELIQVCADTSDIKTLDRELRALVSAAKEYPRAKLRLLILTRADIKIPSTPTITVQPVSEWLLSLDNN